MREWGFEKHLDYIKMMLANIFGYNEALFVYKTYQFEDYSKYVATLFNEEERARIRKKEFPKDCQKAFEMGVRLTQQNKIS